MFHHRTNIIEEKITVVILCYSTEIQKCYVGP
nr:MAG TPA: hypothetical protein [Caudoviricetes sp.]DAT80960.1 MAG TPA: hypothetical protein [Caudoviricetes sp.]DAU20596.1 MAG TPA: hypothetical protein [Caudoviricetes sp.]DAX89434.1 MAG TPA: hypothetical protein [Caudoviricetes sp.]